jgi:hypothetical protein
VSIRRTALNWRDHLLVELVIARLLLKSNPPPLLDCSDLALAFGCLCISHLVDRVWIPAGNLALLCNGELLSSYEFMALFENRTSS